MIVLSLLFAAAAVEFGPPEAIAANNAARDAWGMCVMNTAAKYAGLTESAETIADVAVSNCGRLEPAYRETLDGIRIIDGPMIAEDTKSQLLREARAVFRQHAVGTVLDIRLARSTKAKGK